MPIAVSDALFYIIFALMTLGAAWLVNALTSFLSGEERKDTKSIWLDMHWRELNLLAPLIEGIRRGHWFNWTMTLLILLFLCLALRACLR